MIGAIIGDIVGSRFEFNNTFDYNFELFHKDCSFTDDTICTVAIADAILKGMPYKDSVLKWCREYPHPMGAYGGSFSRWIASDNPQPYDSFGNGAAMRVSPVAWAFKLSRMVISEAVNTADISHNHTEGEVGAASVALMIHSCIHKKDKSELEYIASSYYGKDWEKHLIPKGRFDETCQGTVPLAFHIIKESSSFEDAIRNAVSYGGDSDTLGAVVGSIAEPLFGIPAWMEEKALSYLPAEMIEVVNQFKAKYYE